MKKVMIGLGLGLLSISLSVLAGEKVDKTIKASNSGYIEIEHVNGFAEVKAWDRDEVRVVGELGDRTDRFIFERDGNEIVIKVKVKSSRGWNSWGDDDGDKLAIFVPKGSKVNYSSVNANVEGEGIQGGAQFDTVNGSIDVKDLAGRIRLESVNGEISAKKLSGDVQIETVNGDIKSSSASGNEDRYSTVNGDITITTDSKEIRAETVNGDIELELSDIKHLTLDTVNGSIEARLNLQKNGEVRASTVGGSVTLYFQKDVSARFDIRGHAGGKIINKLSDDKVQKAKYGPSRWLNFSVNEGKGEVNISTVSGRVRVDKK